MQFKPLDVSPCSLLQALSSKTQLILKPDQMRNAKSLDLKAAFANPAIIS